MTNAAYLAKALAPLKGSTFQGVVPNEEMEPDGVALSFLTKDGVTVLVGVWSDEEGNGSGWLKPVSIEGPKNKLETYLPLVNP